MKGVHYTALILTIIGAINWGLIGLFEFDLVAALFGGQLAAGSRIVYVLVGLAGVTLAATSMMLERGDRAMWTGGNRSTMPTR